MKLGKLSLVAVMALGTSAFAVDNVKVDGLAKIIYQTADFETYAQDGANPGTGMFEHGGTALVGGSYGGGAAGGASATVGITADLLKGVSAGAEVQAFSTMGLENNLVNSTMVGGSGADSWAMSQAWLAATMGKTTVKVGRMELDTPLAFTEKWNILKNTFDAAVVINSDVPNTTLVGAWVGKHNGTSAPTLNYGGDGRTARLDNGVEGTSGFYTAGANQNAKGAYAAGAINTAIPATTLQAWYYNLVNAADAYWLQADTKIAGMVSLGGQYSAINTKEKDKAVDNSSIWALKGGVDVAGVNVYAAYSQAEDGAGLGFSNVSTGDKTKIYTGDGSIYMDGIVTAPGTKAYKVGASTKLVPNVGLAASYTSATDLKLDGKDISGWDVSATTNIGALGLQAIYTQVTNDSTMYAPTAAPEAGNGRDIETLRIIASLKF